MAKGKAKGTRQPNPHVTLHGIVPVRPGQAKSAQEAALAGLPDFTAKIDQLLARVAQDDARRDNNDATRSVEYQSMAGVLLRLDEQRRQTDVKLDEMQQLKARLAQQERLLLILAEQLEQALDPALLDWKRLLLEEPWYAEMIKSFGKNYAPRGSVTDINGVGHE